MVAGFEALAADRSGWRYTTESAIKTAEQKREEQREQKSAHRRQRAETDTAPLDDNAFTLQPQPALCSSTTDRHLRAQTPLSPETDGCLSYQVWLKCTGYVNATPGRQCLVRLNAACKVRSLMYIPRARGSILQSISFPRVQMLTKRNKAVHG